MTHEDQWGQAKNENRINGFDGKQKKLARDAPPIPAPTNSNLPGVFPASATNAEHFFGGLGGGHCTVEGRNNDVTKDIKMCECLNMTEFSGPNQQFIADFTSKSGEYLSAYKYGDKGHATNVTYGLIQNDPRAKAGGEEGIIRGLVMIEYNSVAKECQRAASDTFKMAIDEAKAAITAGLGTGIGEKKW